MLLLFRKCCRILLPWLNNSKYTPLQELISQVCQLLLVGVVDGDLLSLGSHVLDEVVVHEVVSVQPVVLLDVLEVGPAIDL